MTDRNDTASFTINVTLPSDVIKTYFDGLAKVEAAKAKPSSSSFNWSALMPLVPLVVPLLQNSFPPKSTKSKAAKKTSGGAEPSSLPRVPVSSFSAGEEETEPSGPPSVESLPAPEESVLSEMSSVPPEKPANSTNKETTPRGIAEAVSEVAENETVNNMIDVVASAHPDVAAGLAQAGGLKGILGQFMPILKKFSTDFVPPKLATPESVSSESSSSTAEISITIPISTPKKEVPPEEAIPAQSSELNPKDEAN